jgi:hypothetical protein
MTVLAGVRCGFARNDEMTTGSVILIPLSF